MTSFFEILLNNKEWIFSGIGVTIIIGVTRFVLSRKPRSQNINAGNSTTNIQTGKDSIITLTSHNHVIEQQGQQTRLIKIATEGGDTRKIRITAGDYQEFLSGYQTVRIEIIEIKKEIFNIGGFEVELFGAVINVSTGGGLVYGGSYCKKTGVNQYIVPLKNYDNEEPNSIYAYHVGTNNFSFFRIFIDHINPYDNYVTLNTFFANTTNEQNS